MSDPTEIAELFELNSEIIGRDKAFQLAMREAEDNWFIIHRYLKLETPSYPSHDFLSQYCVKIAMHLQMAIQYGAGKDPKEDLLKLWSKLVDPEVAGLPRWVTMGGELIGKQTVELDRAFDKLATLLADHIEESR